MTAQSAYDNEKCLLGCMLSGAEIPDTITAAMFADKRNQTVFNTVKKQSGEGYKPNIVTVTSELLEEKLIDDAGGAAYIAGLTDTEPMPSNIGFYAEKVAEAYRVRLIERAIDKTKTAIKEHRPADEIAEALRKSVTERQGAKKSAFGFEKIGSLPVTAPQWLVKGILETDTFSCMYGDPACGKSFLAIALCASVATGRSFYGREVKRPGPVIYLAGEGKAGIARRFRAWSIRRNQDITDAPLFVNHGAVSLIDDGLMVPVANALSKLIDTLKEPPALVVLDTFSRCLGGDDSSPADSAAGVAVIDRLRSQFGNFACMVIHHTGYDKTHARGWSGLRAAVDTEFRVTRGEDDIVRLECTKNKEGLPFDPMAFEFAGVELDAFNEDKTPITSAVLNQTEYTPFAGKEKPLGKNQAIALNALKELAAGKDGERVTVEEWHKKCVEAGFNKYQYRDAKTGLENSGKIIIDGYFISLPGLGGESGGEMGVLLYNTPPPPPPTADGEKVANLTVSHPSHHVEEKEAV
jgi:hypothetical protein